MRTLKFRAWDKKDKRMIFNVGILSSDSKSDWISGPLFIHPTSRRFNLIQYTGLKDKNGKGRWSKEIYEGDIVEVIAKNQFKGERFVIKYSKEWASFIADQGELGMLFFLAKDKTWHENDKLGADEIKVIGNIYESPELLTQSPQKEKA